MTLLTKRIFTGVSLKNLLNREPSKIRTQCYTCISSPCYIQTQNEKFNQIHISNLKGVREFNFDYKQANKLVSKIFGGIFHQNKYSERDMGFYWYKTVDEVNIDEFFTLLQLPDTFYSWSKVIQLHVWMLVFHLRNGSVDVKMTRYIREGVMEAMWMDLEARVKMIKNYHKNYKRNIKNLYEVFKKSLFWYDYGFLGDDITLTTIVWSVFFERGCDDPEKLEAVVRYIRFQMKHLESLSTDISKIPSSGVWTSLRPHCQSFIT